MKPAKIVKHQKARSVADYITAQISLCGKSQIEIAQQAGFEKPNIITMIKQGKTKLPLDKIGTFAKAIEVDPIFLLRMCLNEYQPKLADEIQSIFGQPILSHSEMEILDLIRQSNLNNPTIRTEEDRLRLLEVINSFSEGD